MKRPTSDHDYHQQHQCSRQWRPFLFCLGQELAERLGPDGARALMRRLGGAMSRERPLPALELLSRRFALVALSNGNADVNLVGLGRFFHASVSARDAGVAKPDVRIFHCGAEAAGVAAAQVLHVGDDALLDAQGALDAGMQAVWLRRPTGSNGTGSSRSQGKATAGAPAHHPSQEPATAEPIAPACRAVENLHQLCQLLGLA